jgi:phosphomevalonate kinase
VLGLAGTDPAAHRPEVVRLALAAHRGLQGGGSGYDVATVAHGGLICWWREEERAEQLPWPGQIGFLAGYSGTSARTRRQLDKLAALTWRFPDSARAELVALNRAALGVVEAFGAGQEAAVLEAVEGAHRALERWDQRRGLGIVTPAIAEMVRLAAEAGAAAKVSGAGAGDSVIALGAEDRLAAVASAWRTAGFSPLTVVPTADGVREL